MEIGIDLVLSPEPRYRSSFQSWASNGEDEIVCIQYATYYQCHVIEHVTRDYSQNTRYIVVVVLSICASAMDLVVWR